MLGLSKTWELDARLARDTYPISSDGICKILLMDDARWPWIIVVPMVPDAVDIEDIPEGQLLPLHASLADISRTLKAMGSASTNVATLGNMVTQLHWHVVGRSEGDPGWPAPVWGFGERVPFGKSGAQAFIERYEAARRATIPFLRRV